MDRGTAQLTEDLKAIADTRHAIADKLGLIEQRIAHSVDDVKTKADTFVERTQQSVAKAVDSLTSCSAATDIAARHPWMLLGGSLLLGYAIGVALRPSARSASSDTRTNVRADVRGVIDEAIRATDQARRKPSPPRKPSATAATPHHDPSAESDGILDAIRTVAAQELGGLRAGAIEAAKILARAWVKQGIQHLAATLATAADARITRKQEPAAPRNGRAGASRSRYERPGEAEAQG